MNKIYVLDTNVILTDPKSIFSFEDNEVIIPLVVIEEIDHFKKKMDPTGFAARKFSRIIDDLRSRGDLITGVETREGGTIRIVSPKKDDSVELDLTINDNIIIFTALSVRNADKKVILVSRDINVRIKADFLKLQAETYTTDSVNLTSLPKGYEEVSVAGSLIDDLFINKSLPKDALLNVEIFPNAYYHLKNEDGGNQQAIVRYDPFLEKFTPLKTNKNISSISPRNAAQKIALELILDDRVKLVSLLGKAGTGKTLLAIAAGLQMVAEDGKYSKMSVSKPVIPMGKDIGYLPGSMEEKMRPWIQPIMDNLEVVLYGHGFNYTHSKLGKMNSVEDFVESGLIEVEALTYIRGRSIPNQFIIVDEVQNLSSAEIKTILTRVGEGTKIILTGDPYQVDNVYLDENSNALVYIMEKFKDQPIAGHIILEKGERSELAEIASNIL